MPRLRNDARTLKRGNRRISSSASNAMSVPWRSCHRWFRCRYVFLCLVVSSFVVLKALLSSPPPSDDIIGSPQAKNGTALFLQGILQRTIQLSNSFYSAANVSSAPLYFNAMRPEGTAKNATRAAPRWSVGEIFTNSSRHKSCYLPMVYVVTPTYKRLEQIAELTRLAQTLMHVPCLHWIVVEDAVSFSGAVRVLLRRVGVNFTHMLGPKPARFSSPGLPNKKLLPRGVSNRVAALHWVQGNIKSGVLYFADDDNSYDIRLFEEMRSTKKVSMWPVGLVTNLAVSSPVVHNGRVVGFYDGWVASRKFPVDMAGFAVNIAFLLQHRNVTMPFSVGYEEDGFLRSLGISMVDIEPKAANCTQVLVWHTKTVSNKPPKKLTKKEIEKYTRTNIIQLQTNMW